jgi:hypothetical protein
MVKRVHAFDKARDCEAEDRPTPTFHEFIAKNEDLLNFGIMFSYYEKGHLFSESAKMNIEKVIL